MYSLFDDVLPYVGTAIGECEFQAIDSDSGRCAYRKRIGACAAGPCEVITDAGNSGADEGDGAVSIDVHYSIIVVALRILNGVPESGLMAGTRTRAGLRIDVEMF